MAKKPQEIKRDDGHFIAYHQHTPKQPATEFGIVFCGGYMSDMQGSKAVFLEELCKEQAIPYTRFDYFGHGESSGEFTEGTIGRWKDDVLFVLEHLCNAPQVLIGSSLGGWLVLLAALQKPEKVKAVVGIAAAPDFTEDLMWSAFDEEQKRILREEGVYHLPSDYCNDPLAEPEPYPITLQLIEEGRNHLLLADNKPIALHCPLLLVQGMQDADVPYETALRIARAVSHEHVDIVLQKEGDHRMSSASSLGLLESNLLHLVKTL